MLQFLVRSLNGYDVVHPDKFELHTLIFVFFFSVNYLFRLTNYPVTKTQINFSITKNLSYWEQLFPLHILLFRLPTFMKFLFCQLTKSKTLAPNPNPKPLHHPQTALTPILRVPSIFVVNLYCIGPTPTLSLIRFVVVFEFVLLLMDLGW